MSGALALAGLLLGAAPQPQIASFDALGTALTACIRGDAPSAGTELEVRFVLSAKGMVVGKPDIAVTHSVVSMAAQRDLKAKVFEALRRCTPFALAPDFAQAIAGRLLTLRVLTGGKAISV